jgi:hypothetical protein
VFISRCRFVVPALVACLLPFATPASTIAFTGSATNTNGPPQPDASCSPLLRIAFGPAGTAGTSNFGAFTYTQTHCTTGGPGAYTGGLFSYLFEAGDSLTGSYSGLAAPSGTAGLLNNTIQLIVTGGTGRFTNGSGSITGVGTVDFRQGAPRQSLQLSGMLDLPAVPVPEPASWALMLGGFALVGASRRRGRGAASAR